MVVYLFKSFWVVIKLQIKDLFWVIRCVHVVKMWGINGGGNIA